MALVRRNAVDHSRATDEVEEGEAAAASSCSSSSDAPDGAAEAKLLSLSEALAASLVCFRLAALAACCAMAEVG